jgi:hypothetical protein
MRVVFEFYMPFVVEVAHTVSTSYMGSTETVSSFKANEYSLCY